MLLLNKKIIGLSLCPVVGSVCFLTSGNKPEPYKIMVNYNGQADLLLSLQIPPDYYPYQFKKNTLYDYLTHIDNYIVVNKNTSSEKNQIKEKLQNKMNELLGKVKEFGPSLWNEDLYDSGVVYRNDQFWRTKETSLLFLEQFVADDYVDISKSIPLLPLHKELIITNYRAARDPYTIFSKNVYDCFMGDEKVLTSDSKNNCSEEKKEDSKIAEELKKYLENYDQAQINSLYRSAKYILFWKNFLKNHKDQIKDMNNFGKELQKNLFSLDEAKDKILAKNYQNILFTPEELKKLKEWVKESPEEEQDSSSNWNISYLKNIEKTSQKIKLAHHPALEQQVIPGTAPLAEGSQKDIVMFLYQFAAQIDKYSKSSSFEEEFRDDYRKEHMKSALKNAKKMAKNIETRIANIREYFKKIKVVDEKFKPRENNSESQESLENTSSKIFSIVTYPPASFGAGESTIQSMSKFPFIYYDIGLKQPVPKDLQEINISEKGEEEVEEILEKEIFSVDDNGWWWKVGSDNLDPTNLLRFRNSTDTLLVLAHEYDWSLLKSPHSHIVNSLSSLLKNQDEKIEISKLNSPNYPVSYNKYHLWNEGLRSPIALNLLLDNLVDIFQRQYDSSFEKDKDCYKKAMDWGDYWEKYFILGENVSDEEEQNNSCISQQ